MALVDLTQVRFTHWAAAFAASYGLVLAGLPVLWFVYGIDFIVSVDTIKLLLLAASIAAPPGLLATIGVYLVLALRGVRKGDDSDVIGSLVVGANLSGIILSVLSLIAGGFQLRVEHFVLAASLAYGATFLGLSLSMRQR